MALLTPTGPSTETENVKNPEGKLPNLISQRYQNIWLIERHGNE